MKQAPRGGHLEAETGLSRAQVQNRVATLRIFLAERHDDHRWLTEANTVKVGRACWGEPVEL